MHWGLCIKAYRGLSFQPLLFRPASQPTNAARRSMNERGKCMMSTQFMRLLLPLQGVFLHHGVDLLPALLEIVTSCLAWHTHTTSARLAGKNACVTA